MKQIRHLHAPLCLTPPLPRKHVHPNSNKIVVPLTTPVGASVHVLWKWKQGRGQGLDRQRHVLWVPRQGQEQGLVLVLVRNHNN